MHQNLHYLLLSPRLRYLPLPAIHLRSQHPNSRLGDRNLPRMRRPMPTTPRLLGPQHRRTLFQRARIYHRQPRLQCLHRLRHPGPPHSNDLEPSPRLARQARTKRRLRARRLRLLRQHLPHRRPVLDQSHRPHIHRLPSDAVDAYRACCWADLLQPAHYPRSIPCVEVEEFPQWNRPPVYQYRLYELDVLVQV
jgi:hypothetical protein